MVGKRIQLISHASLAQITLFFTTSALVNKVLGSRAIVGHSRSNLTIPRAFALYTIKDVEIFAFADALQKTFGAVIITRFKHPEGVYSVQFLTINVHGAPIM